MISIEYGHIYVCWQFVANKCMYVQGGPKQRNPVFNFAITSVNVHRF